MSYVPSHQGGFLAQPESLVFIPMTQSSTQAPVVDTAINLDAAQVQFGSWTVTISSDIITLPIGFYYLVESCTQCHYTAASDPTTGAAYHTSQIYDETNSNYIGTKGSVWRGSGEDTYPLFSRDEKCRAFLNCTGGARTISVKTQEFDTKIDRLNYSAGSWSYYAGSGRVIIWRLDP